MYVTWAPALVKFCRLRYDLVPAVDGKGISASCSGTTGGLNVKSETPIHDSDDEYSLAADEQDIFAEVVRLATKMQEQERPGVY